MCNTLIHKTQKIWYILKMVILASVVQAVEEADLSVAAGCKTLVMRVEAYFLPVYSSNKLLSLWLLHTPYSLSSSGTLTAVSTTGKITELNNIKTA